MSTIIVAHFNPNGIPDYLKQRTQWVVWGKRTGHLNALLALRLKPVKRLIYLIICSGQDVQVLSTNHKPT